MKTKLSYDYEHYASTAELPEADRTLVAEAERATRRSHAPYSKFRVGAAARLASGIGVRQDSIGGEALLSYRSLSLSR